MGADWLARNEAGSGGFKLRRYDPAIGFQADRFDEHFAGFGKSNITSMEFRVVLETASRALGLQKGEFNTTDGYLPQDQIKRLRTVDSVQIMEADSLRTMYFIIHNAAPAAERREPAQGAVLRVRLRRVHQQHPERFGRRATPASSRAICGARRRT